MPTHNTYLEDEVRTASPQRLRLMLLDGAIRFARKSLMHWQADEHSAALEALARTRAIVAELLQSVRTERDDCERIVDSVRHDPPLSNTERIRRIDGLHRIGRSTAAVLMVVFRDLNAAQLHEDAHLIEKSIEVLEIERETTHLVCEAMPHAPQVVDVAGDKEISSHQAAAMLTRQHPASGGVFSSPTYGAGYNAAATSMSFDA